MAFAARPAQVNGMEENAAKDNVKGAATAKAGQSLLQQGSKRRAPLGDMSNLVGPLNGRSAVGKDGATKVVEAIKPRAAAARAITKEAVAPTDAPAVAQAAVQTAAPARAQQSVVSAAVPAQPLARTRSQTMAMARQQVAGPSMSSLLQSRSEAAVSNHRPTISAPPSPLPNIEQASDLNNPLAATEYVNDIYGYFKRIEPKYRVQAGYMARQTDINERMRAILVDWLVEVHLKFKLMPETLYLTVNLIDRFLENKAVTRKNLQLVGVTAMLIGSKYEEIWAPEVRDFVYISDKAYTREQILAMEKLMLNTLQFNLTLPTAHNFLARFHKAAGNDKKVLTLATYLSELAMVDAAMLNYSYSLTSAAALYVAGRALNVADSYPHALAKHSGYSREQVLPCAQALVKLMQKAPTHSLSAVFKKYSNVKLMEVANTPTPVTVLEEEVV